MAVPCRQIIGEEMESGKGQKRKRWKKVKMVETERIVNIAELEQIVRDARVDMISLKHALKNENKEASKHLTEQLDLKLHRMEAFEFVLERRTIIPR